MGNFFASVGGRRPAHSLKAIGSIPIDRRSASRPIARNRLGTPAGLEHQRPGSGASLIPSTLRKKLESTVCTPSINITVAGMVSRSELG